MQPNIKTDWISAKEFRKRCGDITRQTEWRRRTQFNLHTTKMGDTIFYDWNQVVKVLNENSTYNLTTKSYGKAI